MTEVQVVNPLPRTLAHYTRELCSTVTGVTWHPVPCDGIEAGSSSLATRVRRHARLIRSIDLSGPLVITWPAFGHLEPALLRRSGPTMLIFHDPTPLRPQRGYGWLARRVGPIAAGGTSIIAHSIRARDVLLNIGYRNVVLLPHPLLLPAENERPPKDSHIVRVLGQGKEARDIGLLASVGARLRAMGFSTEIVGRGWPDVPNWSIRPGFLPEDEFDAVLRESYAVLIPYARFFQSNVAVRALEQGVPVVGPKAGFLGELLGPDWAGLVSEEGPEAWLSATLQAGDATAELRERRLRAYQVAEQQWSSFLSNWSRRAQ